MHTKKSTSSTGSPKKRKAMVYEGLKLQTPILVNNISHTIKKAAVSNVAGTKARHLLMNLNEGWKENKNGKMKQKISTSKYV